MLPLPQANGRDTHSESSCHFLLLRPAFSDQRDRGVTLRDLVGDVVPEQRIAPHEDRAHVLAIANAASVVDRGGGRRADVEQKLIHAVT